jgi:hypothetical protein
MNVHIRTSPSHAVVHAVREMDDPLGRLEQQLLLIRGAILGAIHDPIGDPEKASLHAIADQCLTAQEVFAEVKGWWSDAHAAGGEK